jgi:Methylamine utilisation protein MauE
VIVATVAVLYLAREAIGLPVPVLEARRQVPQWWRETFSPGTSSFLYGLGLGVGFATHLGHGTLVAVALAAVAAGDPVAGAAAMVAFGIARSLAVAVAWWASDRTAAKALAGGLERVAVGPVPALANGLALAAVAIVAAWTAGSAPPQRPGLAPALLLAGAFGWAAAAKAFRPAAWRGAVAAHHLSGPMSRAAVVAVPLAEAAVVALVLAASILVAAVAALALLLAFSAALVRLRPRVGEMVPCGCFGSSRTRSVRVLLLRNLALGLIAAAALAGPDRLDGLRPPTSAELLPAALAAAGAVLSAVMVRRGVALLRESRPRPDAYR